MYEEVKIIPTFYFITILFLYFVINHTKLFRTSLKWTILCLFIGWALFLGLRNIYDEINFDPAFFHYQAKNLSVEEIWEDNYPKVDILLQIIIKFYLYILPDDTIAFIFTEATIVGLIFIGVALFTRFNLNSLLILLSSLVFTNTGILLTGNFLRQGLAVALFLNAAYLLSSVNGSNKKIFSCSSLLSYTALALPQFFAHMSSICLLFLLYLIRFLKRENLARPSSLITFCLLLLVSLILLPAAFSSSEETYSGYAYLLEGEETAKVFLKLIFDTVALALLILTNILIIKSPNLYFNLVIKICCLILSVCIFYSSRPVIALRLEYYLGFLLIIALACVVSNESTNRRANKLITFSSIVAMYVYSYAVYVHPSITNILRF